MKLKHNKMILICVYVTFYSTTGMSAGRMSARLDKCVKQAEAAFQMDVVERRKKFSFLSRYTGHWGTAMDDGSDEDVYSNEQ